MNYLIVSAKQYRTSLSTVLLLTCLFFTGYKGEAQNINNPNATGPMGLEVNSYTGNLFFERTDFVIPGGDIDIWIGFAYNSFNYDENRGFGNGWSFEYDIHYSTDSAGNMVIVWGDGREDTYIPLDNGQFQPPIGFYTQLREYEPGKFALNLRNGIQYFFDDNVTKAATRIQDINNQFITINRSGGRITSLINHNGHSVQFTYDVKGILTKVTDAITSPARSWSYAYDTRGNLTEVTDPLGARDKYTYMINGPMKTVSDKNFNVVNLIYYNDFSLREMIGCNKRLTFSYDTTQLLTVITDHLDNGKNIVNKYYYKKIGKQAWLSAVSGNCCGFDAVLEYDNNGNKIKETDANGHSTRYTYDGRGNLLTVTDALNQTTKYTYAADLNLPVSITDPRGLVTRLEYDLRGNPVKLIEADGGIYTAEYDEKGNITSSTNPMGIVFTYGYDANGNIQSVNGPDGLYLSFNVSPRGELLGFTDPNSNSSSFQYDILGRMTRITDPKNQELIMSYDAMGNLSLLKDKNNEPTVFKHDASNRLREIAAPHKKNLILGYDGMDNITSVSNALGAISSFEYNLKNLLSLFRDAEGNETSFIYDKNGNLITQNFPSGETVTYTYDDLNRIREVSDQTGVLGALTYDANGNVLKYTDATGGTHSFAYDHLNRATKYTDALGNTIHITYDAAGEIKTVTDRNGKTSTATYDDLGRISSITDNNGSVTRIGHDLAGNITSLTDANNNTTTYSYDELHRVKRATFPDGKYTEYTYDAKDNILTFREKDGGVISLTYDSLNRVKTKTLPGGYQFSYEYDQADRVISATNNAGTIYFTYDFLNRLTSETFNGQTVRYSYDIQGRTQTTLYPDLTEIKKTFDNRNRLISVQKNNLPVATYLYNNSNQLISKSFANGLTTSMQYDFAGRLSSITTGNFQNLAFTYDKNGNRTSVIRNNDQSEFFTYDDGNRMLTYKRGVSGGPFTTSDSYTYDALGNRVTASVGGKNITYATNSLNQMVSLNDGSRTVNFIYDVNGNLTFDGKYFKTYDHSKKLLKDSASPSEVILYQYDAIGRMVQKTINGVSFFYTYSGFNPIIERDENEIIKNRTLFYSYLEPLLNEHFETPYYYHQNHLYSVEALTDALGNLKEQYVYDAYGKQSVYDAGGKALAGSITGNRFGFTGQVFDSSTGQNHFLFRTYNPETGLFNQQDPIGYGDGMGMYQYVGNNPANGIDVLGLADCNETKSSVKVVVDKIEKTDAYMSSILTVTGWGKDYMENRHLKDLQNVYDRKFNKMHEMMEKGKWGIAEKMSESANATMKEMKYVKDAGSKLSSGLDKGGKILGGIDVGIKGGKLIGAIADENATGSDVGLAAADLIQSGLGFTPVGGVIGVVDLAVSELTGKSMNQHLSDESMNIYSGYYDEKYSKLERDRLEQYKGTEYYEKYKKAQEKMLRRQYENRQRMKRSTSHTAGDCPQGPPGGTTSDPPGGKNNDQTATTEIIRSHDPNEIIGPEGQPDKRWVSVKDRLPYTVTFENDVNASAPAKYVKVIVPVHEKMDAATFQLSNFGFNNLTFDVPASIASSYQRLDARDSLGMFIDLVAGYDVVKHELFWEFQSIDPVTLMAPDDPLKGFLLLQDTTEEKTKNGHGFVTFSIKPQADAKTLDSILAHADIVFDQNDTIPTNIEKNVIDAVAPVSRMAQLDESYDNSVSLSWSGQDDPHGSGLHYYTLYYSTDGINFSILKEKMARTDTVFTGPGSTTYYFFVLATDSVGNTEQLNPGAVVNTFLGSVVPVSWIYFKGTNKGKDNLLEWATANEQQVAEYNVERSSDARKFDIIGTVKAVGNSGNNSYRYTDYDIDRLAVSALYYRISQKDMNGKTNYSNVIRLNYNGIELTKTIVYPNPTKGMILITTSDQKLVGTTAQVYDEAGKMLQSVKITSLNQSFDLSGYTNGIYFIKLANKEVLKVMKH